MGKTFVSLFNNHTHSTSCILIKFLIKRLFAIVKPRFSLLQSNTEKWKSPLDLFTQCAFLDPWLLDHQSFYSFKTRYAITKQINVSGRMVHLVVGYRNLGELSDKLKPFSHRVLKDDCLDLPEKIYIKREIELTKEQEQHYSTMKATAMALLKGDVVRAPHVLTQLMRLHQITCGHFKSNEGEIQEIKNNRIDELLAILDETEGKAIIWANYIYDIERIVKAIKEQYGEDSVVQYVVDRPYNKPEEENFNWNEYNIEWPLDGEPILSAKDAEGSK